MENGILASIELGKKNFLHIATLDNDTIKECNAEHLGFDGYFIFTVSDMPEAKGFDVLAKASSFDSALLLVEIMKKSNHNFF
ncbi:MAG: hypothetical protein OXC62_15530 [Aestuariivita sp.]|nr:hypothetical protein [Aestuariivita sp.]